METISPKFKAGNYIQNKDKQLREAPYNLQGKIVGVGTSTDGTKFYYMEYKGEFVIPFENQDNYELVNK
jgi:hypothetical protein